MKWIYNKYLSEKSRATLFLLLFMGLTPIFVLSCQEDYLDITPTDSYTEAVVFDDPALAGAFVNYAYRLLPHGFKYGGWTMPLSWVIDENSARLSAAASGPILRGEISPSYLGTLDYWADEGNWNRSYWPAIKQCNEFLKKTEESTLDPELLSSLSAQARTIRAYAYYRLASYFGGVPLITVPFTLDSDWRIGRNSYDEVMNFVFNELDDVINLLPLDYPASEKGKVTKGAAMAIKARALLYYASPLNNPANDISRWQAAANAAKAVIDLGIYELYPDYKELFMEAGGYNSEVIWGRRFNNQIDREVRTEQLFYPNGWRGYGQIHPIQNLVDDYEMIDGLLPKNSSMYDPQDPYVNRDPRFYYTILYDGAPFKERTIETFFPGGQDTNEGPVSAWIALQTFYYPRKFIIEEKTGYGWGATANSDPLWLWFRYGEILLNYAEAMYNLGDEDTCREYINIIRSRPGVEMPPVTESGEELFDRLVNERRIEMVFEEQRYFDVRRWKIAPDVLNRDRNRMYIWKDPDTGIRTFEVRFFQEANFHERNYLLPIPQSEIDRNALLEQNPGYN